MPRVRHQLRRGRVVPGDGQYVRIQGQQARDDLVGFFSTGNFAREIAVLAGAVCVFEVDEEKVVIVPYFLELVDLVKRVVLKICN